jgi:hypothetical protein
MDRFTPISNPGFPRDIESLRRGFAGKARELQQSCLFHAYRKLVLT